MSSMKRFRRMLSVILVAAIVLLCAGLFADDDEGEAAENGGAESASAVLFSDSTINRINAEYRSIEPILRKSCYDCHSAHTDYPWYHNLPIVGGMLDDHIKEGREHLDLTDGFPFGGEDDQAELLADMRKEIEAGDMPLLGYRLMHWGTLIEGARRDSVFNWIDRTLNVLRDSAQLKN